ncbi:MAG: hypothetical protein M1283_03155, partial [Gammaproteobacteria bacterium]|nr:hypothetical protein [Gammaproteobacteria bacterium]
MNPAALIDYGTLKWVKGEIDQSLAEARHALEAFVINPHDSAQMRFCVTHLHQVHGTVQMIELHGGRRAVPVHQTALIGAALPPRHHADIRLALNDQLQGRARWRRDAEVGG